MAQPGSAGTRDSDRLLRELPFPELSAAVRGQRSNQHRQSPPEREVENRVTAEWLPSTTDTRPSFFLFARLAAHHDLLVGLTTSVAEKAHAYRRKSRSHLSTSSLSRYGSAGNGCPPMLTPNQVQNILRQKWFMQNWKTAVLA